MVTDAIEEFREFLNKEFLSAANELENITSESGRKHLQKLVYTNLVDRFDYMVDQALIENWSHETLVSDAVKNLEKPFTEAEFVKGILSGKDLKSLAETKIQETLKTTVLRERHSGKLSKLSAIFAADEEVWNRPRVNISTGEILNQIKPQNKSIPYSICGYADWLYSRRNSIVHGGGAPKFLKNDADQIKRIFKCAVAKSAKIQLSSLKVTGTFYLALINLLLRSTDNQH